MLLARRLAAARSVKAAAGVHSRGSWGARRGSAAARGSGAGGGTEALREASGTRGSGRAGGSDGTGSGAAAVARSSILGSSGTGEVVRNGSLKVRAPGPPRESPRPLRVSPRAASDDKEKAFGSSSGAREATGALGVRPGTTEPTRYGRPKKISKNVGVKAAAAMANPRSRSEEHTSEL